ncbi:hypothetical protein SFRURICE_005743 [Spodoptera frugiperda]|nr:hypothetical protein SFRURICE_005743 [Spodoptera frugiperda]
MIRLLVIIQLIKTTRCQNGFSEQDILRFQQMASNDGHIEAINNILQREQNNQPISSPSISFNLNEDTNKNNNYGRTFYPRSRKIYRIKNPFQQQIEETEKQPENTEAQDSGAGASNQYASMQYSLPPEEFLQQLRAENQYYQQSQVSTPAPNIGYTATPQPQYQYSTVSSPNYDSNNQQNNQIPLEPKASHGATYLSSPSPYQFSTPNAFLDSAQSTASPIPSYLSTPLNNGQYTGTPSSSYVSSSSPLYLSSPNNLQSYVSSPLSVIQTGTPEYNRVSTTIGNNPVSNDYNDQNKKMQIDHYDYAGNGVRYPANIQQQFSNEYSSSSTTTSSPYQDQIRESWQNTMNSNMNAASKSIQDSPYNQYQNYQYPNSQQDARLESNADNVNSETHRIGTMASANNLYVNYVQPDNQMLNNLKLRTRDLEQETGQEIYSNGDFGWKLTGKKPLIEYNSFHPRYSSLGSSSDGPAVSQMNFHMETDNKPKQPFDHDKALKNIVPIDVSNVVATSDSSVKSGTGLDNNGRYANSYQKDQLDQNVRQYLRPVTDSFYKDKNSLYGFNIKTKSDDYVNSESLKQLESSIYGKQSLSTETNYNPVSYPGQPQGLNYLSQQANYQDNMQSPTSQQGYNRNQQSQLSSELATILKLNDIPYKLTQGMSTDALKLHNINFDQGGIPTPLPMRINQNVGSHQLDVTTNLLSKLLLNKQPTLNLNRPEIDSQTGSLLSTINGFKVANPFNMDLKLVAEMLKGKPTVDDSQMIALRDQYTKPAPLKFDMSQLQFLLKNENTANLAPINDGLSALDGSYLDLYNTGRYPYQGVKYSRSQEEEESIVPIADASNTHPIGAVMEQDDLASERDVSSASDITGQGDDIITSNFEESRTKSRYMPGSRANERHRHPNMLSGRHMYQRKYPKADVDEPYPLLKPPPPHSPVGRGSHMKMEKHARRRRVNKPKLLRIMKTEPLFEAGAETESLETSVPILLRPPPPVAESKSDTVSAEDTT